MSAFSAHSAFSALSALKECVPTKKTELKSKMFRLVRTLRGIKEVADSFELQQECFNEWCRLSSGVGLGSLDTLFARFLDSWDRAVFPIGFNPAEEAWRLSEGSAAPEAARFPDPKVRRLVSWFRELQRFHPSGAIFISSRLAADKLEVSSREAWLWESKLLEKAGVLFCVQRGNAHRATRYRYLPLIGKASSMSESSEWDFDREDERPADEMPLDDESDEGEEVKV